MSGAAGGLAEPPIIAVERLALTVVPKPWPWADAHRREIDDHFAALRRERPSVWNGWVLLMHRQVFADGEMRGEFLETDFASLDAWRRWDRPDPTVKDCSAGVAIASSDGAWLLGRMAADTANAGLTYFPAGTPDRDDIVDGAIDFERSAWRELREETGLTASDVTAEPGWTVVNETRRAPVIKVVRSPEPAERLRARILANLAVQPHPELADICIVRSAADLNDSMPLFVGAFLEHRWSRVSP